MKKIVISMLVLAAISGAPTCSQAALSKAEMEQRLLATESRLKRLESSTSTQVVLELLERVEQLQSENSELLGRIEEQQNELDKLRKRQRDLYLDIDRRLTEIQLTSGGGSANGQAEAVTQETPGDTAAATETPQDIPQVKAIDPLQERADYEAAFSLLREGRHGDAIEAFNVFLKNYPGGKYAHNAQYWIGEANYVTRNFDAAVTEFNKVLNQYPNSNKDADARLKLGYTYYELKQWEKAKKTLVSVVKKFPTSNAASLAEKRLLIMTQENR